MRSLRLAFSSYSCRLAISVCPLRGHLELSKTAPSVCLVKNENTSIKSFGQIDSSRIKQHLQKLRSDSFQKFSSCFATACIWKISLRSVLILPSRHFVAARWFSKQRGGSARSGLKSLIQIKQISQYRYQYINVVYNSLYMSFYIHIFFFKKAQSFFLCDWIK